MERTRKEIHQLNTLLEVIYHLLGETGRITHKNAINDFGALIDEIKEIPQSPHYIKDGIKGTVTVVPQGKEKEFIESTTVAQPQQLKTFTLLWGLLKFNY
jgi:hypothetical protein